MPARLLELAVLIATKCSCHANDSAHVLAYYDGTLNDVPSDDALNATHDGHALTDGSAHAGSTNAIDDVHDACSLNSTIDALDTSHEYAYHLLIELQSYDAPQILKFLVGKGGH